MPEAVKSYEEQIGDTAGLIWQNLRAEGAKSLSRLSKEIDAPPNVVMHAVGWLAREGKVDFEENGRTRVVSLK